VKSKDINISGQPTRHSQKVGVIIFGLLIAWLCLFTSVQAKPLLAAQQNTEMYSISPPAPMGYSAGIIEKIGDKLKNSLIYLRN
jgi:hypothetical protein